MEPWVYILIANIVAGVHVVLIIYFLGGWLIPFTTLRKRIWSAFIIGSIFAFFHITSICPLTVWEYRLRRLGEGDIENVWMIERLSVMLGIPLNSSILNVISWVFTFGITTVVLTILIMIELRRGHIIKTRLKIYE